MEARLQELPGSISFYYKNLVTGSVFAYREDEKQMAASVIKLYLMAEVFRRIENGTLDADQMIVTKKADFVPSCGAVAYMHEGLQVTLMDLVTLMIIFSDNTATNLLIDILKPETINDGIQKLGFRDTWFGRKMYDIEKSKKGIQNLITARETGEFLERLYHGSLVSRKASEQMLGIMKNQQVNSKIPFELQALPEEPEIAHKTGEDVGITHDVGIVFGKEPFIVCFCGNQTTTPAYERLMAEISLRLYQEGLV